MNEKEAREIILKETTGDHMCRADGYLEALDKAKGLEEALIAITQPCECNPSGPCECDQQCAKEALAKYRSEK